jgi:hypothetical protein
LEKEVETMKTQRKNTPRHIKISELTEEERFARLSSGSKHFVDTIKMISYRAESSMAFILRDNMIDGNDARSLLKAIYNTSADYVVDDTMNTLTVRLHSLANWKSDADVRFLCNELNATETTYPGTKYRMIFDQVSSQNPRGKDL